MAHVRPDQRATRRHPCPCCGSVDGKCLIYMTGGKQTTACYCCNPPEHLRNPALETFNHHFGMPFWIVFYDALGGLPEAGITATQAPTTERWEGYLRAYHDLHARLELSPDWEAFLLARGFTPPQIERFGYRSLPHDLGPLVERLHSLYEAHWEQIPGFVYRDGQPTLIGAGCLVLPIRDPQGEIAAFQLRSTDAQLAAGRPKYCWLSHNGLLGTPFHFVSGQTETLVLTEGPLKADLLSTCVEHHVLSWQGVSAINQLDQTLPQLPASIEEAWIANDMDGWYDVAQRIGTDKAMRPVIPVTLGILRAIKAIRETTPWRVRVVRWPIKIDRQKPEPKGIDDLYRTGDPRQLEFLTPTAYWEQLKPLHRPLRQVLNQLG
jgi:hypothetical protein